MRKSRLVALILALLLGYLGVHRFYLGRFWTALLMMLTLGGAGIWWLVDIILLACGKITDRDGRYVFWFGERKQHEAPRRQIPKALQEEIRGYDVTRREPSLMTRNTSSDVRNHSANKVDAGEWKEAAAIGKSKYTDDFKLKVARAALEDGATLKSVGQMFGVSPTLVRNWKNKFSSEARAEGSKGGGGVVPIESSSSSPETGRGDLYKITVMRVEQHSVDEGDWVSATNGSLDGPEVKISLLRAEWDDTINDSRIAVYINGQVSWFSSEDEENAYSFVINSIKSLISLNSKEENVLFQIISEGDDCDYRLFFPDSWELSIGGDEIRCDNPSNLNGLLAVNVVPHFGVDVVFEGDYAEHDSDGPEEHLVMECLFGNVSN